MLAHWSANTGSLDLVHNRTILRHIALHTGCDELSSRQAFRQGAEHPASSAHMLSSELGALCPIAAMAIEDAKEQLLRVVPKAAAGCHRVLIGFVQCIRVVPTLADGGPAHLEPAPAHCITCGTFTSCCRSRAMSQPPCERATLPFPVQQASTCMAPVQ